VSNDLETIVRSSQTLDYAPARTYYTPGQVGVPNSRLAFGRDGQGKTFSGSFSYNASFYVTQYNNEKTKL
jgi:hypothetical protein